MEPKKPPKRALVGVSPPRLPAPIRAPAGPVILDFVKCRIEAFNRTRRRSVGQQGYTGYILSGEDTGVPIAKLRRKGKRGEFEVLYWNRETGP